MELKGSVQIQAPREKVWAALKDIRTFSRCIPGVQEVEVKDTNTVRILVEQQVGFLRARFELDQQVVSAEPYRLRIVGDGKAPAAGSMVQMTTDLEVCENGEGALLNYQVDLKVFGRLAAVGYMAIQAKAKEMERELTRRMQEEFSVARG